MKELTKQYLIDSIKTIINEAIGNKDKKNTIYNETSLQFVLGERLKDYFKEYNIEYERNISYFEIYDKQEYNKKEIDIVIYDKDKETDKTSNRYAIELKYPAHRRYISNKDKKMAGEYPYRMSQFVDDIIFMDKLKKSGFTKTFSIVVVDDEKFHSGSIESDNEIYQCFRKQKNKDLKEISGIIKTPTKNDKNKEINLTDVTPQKINWEYATDKECAFYVLEF